MNEEHSANSSKFYDLVNSAVEQRVAEWQSQFAQTMQQTMQQSVEHLESVRQQVEDERKLLSEEIDKAKHERQLIINKSTELLRDALEKNYSDWKDQTEKALLRQLATRHLLAAKSAEEIAMWLDVELELIEEISNGLAREQQVRRDRRTRDCATLPDHPRVRYESKGRGGTIHFENDHTKFSLWWEFAGRDALAIIELPSEGAWEARTGISLADREATIWFIAEQVLEDQTTSGGAYHASDNILTIYT